MLVLGIETSCDETAAGVVQVEDKKVLSNVIASQHATHAPFGGVVPELASRQHLRAIAPVIEEALAKAGVGLAQLEGIAATHGPGLAGSLHVGLAAAKGLALARDLPFIGVNHLEGHLLAGFLEHPGLSYPFLGLLVSGGHTALYAMHAPGRRERLAATLDDAVGEAFDKVAKLLGLGFPGGPALDLAASQASGAVAPFPLTKAPGFSYSGLKTAVRTRLDQAKAAGAPIDTPAWASAFQEAAIRPLIKRLVEASAQTGYTSVVAGGGVAVNSLLRQELQALALTQGLKVHLSSPALCVDNGAMIAYAWGLRMQAGEHSKLDLEVVPDLQF